MSLDPDDGVRGMDCSKSSDTYLLEYRTPAHWAPTQTTPPKTVLVNFIICRNSAGENGWENTIPLLNHLLALTGTVSHKFAAPQARGYTSTCQPSFTEIEDSGIRFELNFVTFIDNDAFNGAFGYSGATAILDYVWANIPSSKGQMNHIFSSPGWDDGVGYQGYHSTYAGHSFVHSINLMLGSYPGYSDDWDFYKRHLAHEYGHALGLHHTYDGTEPRQIAHYDFLDDMWGTCPEPLVMSGSNPCYSGGVRWSG